MNERLRKYVSSSVLALFITFMHIAGWHFSVDYNSLVSKFPFPISTTTLSLWQYVLWGLIELPTLSVLFTFLFSILDKKVNLKIPNAKFVKWIWPISFILLFGTWLIFLWGCFPGYLNYDGGNQLLQVLYDEVPYNAHHPLLHTLFSGGLITLGYRLNDTDLRLGVLLQNFVQIFLCSLCLSYSISYIYKKTAKLFLTIFAFVFYAFCPPIVMFAMSTTKDVLCFSTLLVGSIQLYEIFQKLEHDQTISWKSWTYAGIFITFSCLIRKNVVYGLIVFIVFSLFYINKKRKIQLILYFAILLSYFFINKGLLIVLDATPGSVNEALCVPYQQISRLYTLEGRKAFTTEEHDLLSQIIPPEVLPEVYDPVMADHTKANFNPGLETLLSNKEAYLKLWIKKGLEYPHIYIGSLLYNTYQAWYPGTAIMDYRGIRYFDVTGWQDEFGTPHWQGLYDFYFAVRYGEYDNYPILRLFFVTATMFWTALISLFYGIRKKDRSWVMALLLIILVSCTNFLGPVSDIRYYLILFYSMPLCLSYLFKGSK